MPGLNEALRDYFRACRRANECFLELTARALNLEPSTFAGDFEGDSWLNPPAAGLLPVAGGQAARYAPAALRRAHGLAVLYDRRPGQARFGSGSAVLRGAYAEASEDCCGSREHHVRALYAPVPGALTVNAGDQIQILTNGIFRSCVRAWPTRTRATRRRG